MNIRRAASLLLAITALSTLHAAAAEPTVAKPTPVILATDIGDDIDDTWALGLLLKSPELDLKLAVGEYGKPLYRAKLLAKFLQATGHGNVPIGMGMDAEPKGDGGQAAWVKGYELKTYPGKVFADGVQAIIDTVKASPEPVTIIAIGPMPNLAAALARDPGLARHARFVGMYGSVRVGYGGSKDTAAEWNVKADAKACQAAFAAPWEMLITPLDTCGIASLEGARYAQVRDSKDPVAAAVVENYRLWSRAGGQGKQAAESHSSTLFDTVAVYLAIRQNFCRVERLGLRVTDDGFTRIDPAARKVDAATAWVDLEGFKDFLAQRLAGPR